MKYQIEISGGFTGGLREFKGELSIDDQKKEKLKQIFKRKTTPVKNENLRDAFQYDIILNIDHTLYKATFNDTNIPTDLMNLIELVKKSKQ